MNSRTSIGRQASRDPVLFASISGKVDAVAQMRREAKDLSDARREDVRKVSVTTDWL